MIKCDLCPRHCNAKRDNEENIGYCGMTNKIKIAKADLFYLEEPCISGSRGSGAVFFSGCNLRCVFCQNYEISKQRKGKKISIADLAQIFKEMEQKGAHNINLVSPSHYANQIIEALKIYKPSIPIVYNSNGYETIETIEKIAPFVDIFLPDIKYMSSFSSEKYSNCSDYFEICSKAVLKMASLKQNKFDENTIMQSGIIIRHLVLPLHTDDSISILKWIKDNLPKGTYVSLMSQFTPMPMLKDYPELNRKITPREYQKVKSCFLELELNGYLQDISSSSCDFIPKWDI